MGRRGEVIAVVVLEICIILGVYFRLRFSASPTEALMALWPIMVIGAIAIGYLVRKWAKL